MLSIYKYLLIFFSLVVPPFLPSERLIRTNFKPVTSLVTALYKVDKPILLTKRLE